MTIDLNDLSTKQLDTLISKARKRKTKLAKRKPIASVRRKLVALAKSEGYAIDELFGTPAGAAKKAGPRKGRKLGKVPPKYRNPANTTETWTGRGKQPRWLAAEVAKGRKLESFLIKKGPVRKTAAKKAAAKKTKAKTKARKAAPGKTRARKAK